MAPVAGVAITLVQLGVPSAERASLEDDTASASPHPVLIHVAVDTETEDLGPPECCSGLRRRVIRPLGGGVAPRRARPEMLARRGREVVAVPRPLRPLAVAIPILPHAIRFTLGAGALLRPRPSPRSVGDD